MKKLLTATIVFALIIGAVSSYAQEATGLTGKGVKVGLNLANLTGDDVEDTSMKLGIIGGGFITYQFTELFAIQPEVLFAMEGAKSDFDSAGVTESRSLKLNYIEVPILFKVLLVGGGNFKPNFYAGPSINFLMSAKAEDVDVKDFYKSTGFGLIGGVGADLLMGEMGSKVTMNLRYNVGLSSIAETVESPLGDIEPDVKTSTISLMVGYSF